MSSEKDGNLHIWLQFVAHKKGYLFTHLLGVLVYFVAIVTSTTAFIIDMIVIASSWSRYSCKNYRWLKQVSFHSDNIVETHFVRLCTYVCVRTFVRVLSSPIFIYLVLLKYVGLGKYQLPCYVRIRKSATSLKVIFGIIFRNILTTCTGNRIQC